MKKYLHEIEMLAQTFGTDKFEHGYLKYYQELLPDDVGSILEIGCFKGASLKMWKEIYPEAWIYTADLFEDPANMSEAEARALGFGTYKADQGDVYSDRGICKVDRNFDVIIDDGSHRSDHQWTSFNYLFGTRLNPGGVYVVEDLHCCNEPFYWGGIQTFEDTMLYKLKEHEKFRNNSLLNDFPVGDVRVFDDKIAFLWKKK